MRRIVVGTAGHIDHGKTSLVEALTGIDCDRWQEEKERGITIDLGFAHLEAAVAEGAEPLQIGFVDVPGHERFVHNALAGLGGIRMMMLVVAADEGIKPQTEEHLAICSLLDIPAGLVALTKIDLVAEDLRELAALELEEALEGTPFEGVPIVEVSSKTGEGVTDLRTKLVELAEAAELEEERSRLPVRLPIDRSFVLKGLGVVVTGTLMSGSVRAGDTLERLPAGAGRSWRRGNGPQTRVRSVQVHGEERDQALAGERTSLQLTGLGLEELARGQQLVTPASFRTSRSLLVRFRLLPGAPKAIRGFTPIRFHLTSTEALGKLRPLRLLGDAAGLVDDTTNVVELPPGAEALCEIRLDKPVLSIRGDRFITRRPSPQTTLGGGEILDPAWLRRRGASLEAALAGLSDKGESERDAALLYWVRAGGEAGAEPVDLARRLGLHVASAEAQLERLVQAGTILDINTGVGQTRRFVLPSALEAVTERAGRVLREYFKREPMAHGIPKAEAKRRIAPGRAALLADAYLVQLAESRKIVLSGDLVNLPGRSTQLVGAESKLSDSIEAAYREAGLKPPSPKELCQRLSAKSQIFDGVVKFLLREKRLVRLPGDLIIARSAVEKLVEEVRAADWQQFSVPEFKDRFALSRKWAIPLLEHLDHQRVTRRVGDAREVVRPR